MVDKVDQVVDKVEESKEKCYEGSSYLVSIVCFFVHLKHLLFFFFFLQLFRWM